MSLTVIEVRRSVATLVVRPLDALREALGRLDFEQGPVRPVRFGWSGQVQGANLLPIPDGPPKPVYNLSGDTVFRNLRFPAGTYRLELVRDPFRREDGAYEDILPVERDVAWDPATPLNGIPGLPSHVSRLVTIRLRPGAGYPFPSGSTLVRGSFLWYDGSSLIGAVVREPNALLTESRVGSNGDFVLAFQAVASSALATLQLDVSGVDATSKLDGLAFLAGCPAVWPTVWRRGTGVAVHQPGLTGAVRQSDGRRLSGASVSLSGQPGVVRTDVTGRWVYHFPPLTPAGSVNISVQHPNHPTVAVPNVGFPADATATVPPIVMP